jgi:hypothetical protein
MRCLHGDFIQEGSEKFFETGRDKGSVKQPAGQISGAFTRTTRHSGAREAQARNAIRRVMTRDEMHDPASAGEGSGKATANTGRNYRYPF